MQKTGQKVVVWGDHFAAVDTAEFLASIGKEVTVVTEAKELGGGLEVIHMYVTREKLSSGACRRPGRQGENVSTSRLPVHENATVYQIKDDKVILIDKDFNKFEVEADTVVNCHGKTGS